MSLEKLNTKGFEIPFGTGGLTMKKLASYTGITAAVLFITLTVQVAQAGPLIMDKYLDIYLGYIELDNEVVSASRETFSWFGSSSESAERDVVFSSPGLMGGRWGFWFKKYPRYGLALDLSYMKISGEDVSIHAIPASGLLFYRYPLLVSKNHPHGKVQPYFGMGVTLITGYMSVDFSPDISEKINAAAGGSGIDLRVGLKTFVSRKIGLFLELRHLQGNISITDEADPLMIGLFLSDTVEEARTGISSQQILAGVSIKL